MNRDPAPLDHGTPDPEGTDDSKRVPREQPKAVDGGDPARARGTGPRDDLLGMLRETPMYHALKRQGRR